MMTDNTFIRPAVFFTVLVIMVILERCFPARQFPNKQQSPTEKNRLIGNFGLIIISGLCARLILPLGLAGFALYCSEQQWGLFNQVSLPNWLIITLSFLLLDILIYWQHRLFHKVPLLWRLHQVHHADPHIDSSSGLRFHPLEIIASIAIKAIAIFILGVPATAVILFEILLNGLALFNHANISLPKKVEKVARHILMTQILHRIHHSQRISESNSNYGFSVIWWDKLFGSYLDSASKPDRQVDIGLVEYPNAQQNSHLWGLLMMPFNKNR